MEEGAQVVSVRGKDFFVCQYTGALLTHRYFYPVGKRGKAGCYATLPILLRHVFELNGNKFTSEVKKVKADIEAYFTQPDVPMQPSLPDEQVPLSEQDLFAYLCKMDKGEAWLLVAGSESIETFLDPKSLKRKSKRVKK